MPRDLAQGFAFPLGCALALFLSPFSVRSAQGAEPDPERLTALEASLHRDVNSLRASRHLIPMQRLAELDRVARAHSADMARRGYANHVNPEGLNPVERIHGAGVEGFTLAAENIGRTNRPRPNREIVSAWIASPDHRRNLYAPVFNATGIGVARAPDGTLFFTQIFVTYPR
ncbi:MAG: CAP domain-containing protein [Myxococcota bacterium]